MVIAFLWVSKRRPKTVYKAKDQGCKAKVKDMNFVLKDQGQGLTSLVAGRPTLKKLLTSLIQMNTFSYTEIIAIFNI
jgi:hypothetical protein